MNLPNRLTVIRIILIPFILFCMLPLADSLTGWANFTTGLAGSISALVLFSLASLTDLFDGRIARREGLVTKMGIFLDPIADKLLVISVLTAFVQRGRIHAFIVVIVIARELAVTGIRLLGAEQGKVIASSYFGKCKTVTQMIAIIWCMLEPIIMHFMDKSMLMLRDTWLYHVGNVLIAIAVIMTVLSGLDYAKKNKDLFKDVG